MGISWPYIAGFFDGEGHIGLTLGANRRNVVIAQAGARGQRVLSQLQEFLRAYGVTSSVRNYQYKSQVRKQPLWTLQITEYESTCKFVDRILPFLTIKKVEAQDFSRFLQLYPPRISSKLRSETARAAWEVHRGR